jgi:hypothetical protein
MEILLQAAQLKEYEADRLTIHSIRQRWQSYAFCNS